MSGGAKGIGLGIDFAIGNQYKRKGGKSYIDPAVLSSVVSVISTYGKTNEDADRSILKDKTGKGNDFKLLNFGFAGNSGYGMYSADFTTWLKSDKVTSVDYKSFNFDTSVDWVLLYHKSNIGKDTPSFKVHINAEGNVYYNYINQKGILKTVLIESENFETPVSYNTLYVGETPANIGFSASTGQGSITQLPDFKGWLCTDGVDDIIESVKPVSEMLEGSNEITVVSIIHQISSMSNVAGARNNNIRASYNEICLRNIVGADGVGKTGIYGYTCANIRAIPTVPVTVNNILGDKNDYSSSGVKLLDTDLFSVQGFRDRNSGALYELSQVAYAGGFIANKVLTTDEINQIIAYFNLDRPGQIIKPQLYCNIKKQGITNDNHAEFNDQLIDFVGGRNVQLNNVAWEGESGINSYPVVLWNDRTWVNIRKNDGTNWNYEVSATSLTIHKTIDSAALLYTVVYLADNGAVTSKIIPQFKINIKGLKADQSVYYYYITEDRNKYANVNFKTNGEHICPMSYAYELPETPPTNNIWIGFRINTNGDTNANITIEILPTIENALCLDGISDFGKATGLPILKDYTVVADRKIIGNNNGGTLSKSYAGDNGAFIFETGSVNYSFGTVTQTGVQSNRMLSYLSKYIYNGSPIQVGTGIDRDSMWLGTIRDGDPRFSKFALWSLMLFPYSLSEFLLERQLKKYKAGTLYPDMIEFRPIVKSNIPYKSVRFFYERRYGESTEMFPGEYYSFVGEVSPAIYIETYGADEAKSVTVNGEEYSLYYNNDGSYSCQFSYNKSPQKIDIIIKEVNVLSNIKNSTWISNEQLIKNK